MRLSAAARLHQFKRIHAAASFDQIMGFVYQQGDAPVVATGQAEEQGGHVEVVVVVADHHIRPAAEFLAQVIGTNLVARRPCVPQSGQPVELYGSFAAPPADDQKALGQRNRNRMGGFVRVLTAFCAPHARAREGAWRVFLTAQYPAKASRRQFSPGFLAAERTAGPTFCFREAFQLGKQRTQVSTYSGGWLGHQAVSHHAQRDRTFSANCRWPRRKIGVESAIAPGPFCRGQCGARFPARPRRQSGCKPIKKDFSGLRL